MTLRKISLRITVFVGVTITVAWFVVIGFLLYLFLFENRKGRISDKHSVCLIHDTADVRAVVARQRALLPQEKKEIRRYIGDLNRILAEAEQSKQRGKSLSSARWKLKELDNNPERYISERITFIETMKRAPCTIVPPGALGFFVDEQEGAGCSANVLATSHYVKVRITSGPAKDAVGWLCESDDIAHTLMWP